MLKEKINQKLKSEKGTSIFFGLLLFLVASVVSVVILEGAVTTVKRVESDRKAEQNYLTCSSAAKLLRDEIVNSTITQTITKIEKTNWNGSVTSSDPETNWAVTLSNGDDFADKILLEYVKDFYKNKDMPMTTSYTRNLTVSVPSNVADEKEKANFGEVAAEMIIEKSTVVSEAKQEAMDISVKLVAGTGSDTCKMLLRLSGTVKSEVTETTEKKGGTTTKKTTTTTEYKWEPLRIIYGDTEVNLD